MCKVISAQIPEGLYNKLQEYKHLKEISSDSEAIRDILRKYLLDIFPNENSNRRTHKELFFERGATDGSVSSTNQG